jgi:hypothetical protein
MDSWASGSIKERSAKTRCSQIHKFDPDSGAEISYDVLVRFAACLPRRRHHYGKYGKNKKRREFRSAAFVDED